MSDPTGPSILDQTFGAPAPKPRTPAPPKQSVLDNVFGGAPAPTAAPASDTLAGTVARGVVATPEGTGVRPAPTQHTLEGDLVATARGVAQTILDIPQIAAGSVRYLGRAAGRGALQGQAAAFAPQTPEEQADADRFRQGTALAASVAVGGAIGPAVDAVLPEAILSGSGGAQTLVRGLMGVAKGFVRGAGAGEVYGALRPTRPDEARLDAIFNDALGFGAIDAGARAVLTGAMATAGMKTAQTGLAGASEAMNPKGVGPILSSPVHMHDDLVAAGLQPERAWGVLRGQVPLDQAWREQFAARWQKAFDSGDPTAARAIEQEIEKGVAASRSAVGTRGFTWLTDGRPVEAWPNHGEMFVARQKPDGTFITHVANETNTVAAHGTGRTMEDALLAVRGLAPSASFPTGAITETGAAVSAQALTTPPAPEFSGFFGGLRYLTQAGFSDRFAAVRRGGYERVAAALNNQAASQVSAGYFGLMAKRLSGIESFSASERQLLGDWFNAREGTRLRTRLGARIAEAEQRVADGAGEEWATKLSGLQSELAAVRVPELTAEQQAAFARAPKLAAARQWLDGHLFPLLEDWKFMTGLSRQQLDAGLLEEPIFSLVPKTQTAQALEGAAQVESAVARMPPPAGAGGPVQARYRVGATRAALERTGAGEYENDIHVMLDSWVQDLMPRLSKRATFEEITNLKGVRPLERGERPDPGYVSFEFSHTPKMAGLETGGTWQVPPEVRQGYDQLATRRGLLSASPQTNAALGALDFFTQLQLAAPVEASSHAWRIASQLGGVPGIGPAWARAGLLFPSLGAKGTAIYEITRTGSDPAAFVGAVRHLARLGALTGRPLSEEARHGLTQWLDQSTLLQAPRKFLFGMPRIGPGLDGFETRVRVAGYSFIRNFVQTNLGREATDNEIRQFVNGWGTYGTEMQPTFLALMRKARLAAFGSFQTSAMPREMTRMLGWLLPGTSGGTGLPQSIWRDLPLTKRAMLRTEVAWRGMIGDMVFRAATTKAASGYWPWEAPHRDSGHLTDVAIGATGEGDDQRFVYAKGNIVDPGITRAWRTTGSRALATGLLAGNLGQGVQAALIDYSNLVGGILSPWTRFASVAATGKALYMTGSGDLMQQSPPAPTAGGQVRNNLLTALASGNPILAQVAEERNAVRNLPDPLAQTGAMLLNAVTPGMTVGPRRAIWSQLAASRQQSRLLDFVSQRASDILDAPNDEEFQRRLEETQQQIQDADVPDPLKAGALSSLQRTLRSRPRARARRAAVP